MKFVNEKHGKQHAALAAQASKALNEVAAQYGSLADAFGKAGFDECAKFYRGKQTQAASYTAWYLDEKGLRVLAIARAKAQLAKAEAELAAPAAPVAATK